MKRGKQTCKILKDIRRQIAEANDIEFITSECQYQGDCLDTCPKCESEVHYLEQQLERKRTAGKAIALLGISAGLVAFSPMTSCSSSLEIPIEKTDSKAISYDEGPTAGIIETMPEFPGGPTALMNYLTKEIRYPKTNESVSGRVIVQFTVTKKGEITNAKIVRGIHPLFDKEVLRVIKKSPKWKPGKMYRKPINTLFTVPVTFRGKQTDNKTPNDKQP